jgi:hypothetical protein
MATQYKQVDFVTESNNRRGGKRDGAGRKSIHGGETKPFVSMWR